jgi:hypothetical protein
MLIRGNEVLLVLSRVPSDLYNIYYSKSPRYAVENLRSEIRNFVKGVNENLPVLFKIFVRFG